MGKRGNVELLLALLGTSSGFGIDGDTIARRLADSGRVLPRSRLLAQLLALEASGHVEVLRNDGYKFRLTNVCEDTAYALGPGEPLDVVLVMVDLVGYVAFTEEHGDVAAHQAARTLHDVADSSLQRAGGTLVKLLGDGFLGTVRAPHDGVATVQRVAERCLRPDGQRWPVRAAVHRGRPISYQGDLFGADVNLTARLCAAARPGELLMTAEPGTPAAEPLDVRGLREPITVTRTVLP